MCLSLISELAPNLSPTNQYSGLPRLQGRKLQMERERAWSLTGGLLQRLALDSHRADFLHSFTVKVIRRVQ